MPQEVKAPKVQNPAQHVGQLMKEGIELAKEIDTLREEKCKLKAENDKLINELSEKDSECLEAKANLTWYEKALEISQNQTKEVLDLVEEVLKHWKHTIIGLGIAAVLLFLNLIYDLVFLYNLNPL